ncbi:hypothetical protein C4K26_1236 [Pseudomonas chlororaphis]|nr:hypothetical protein C4K26_1236 [Pseudomonas chlororaphis]
MYEFLQTQKCQSPSAGLCAGEKKPLSRWGVTSEKQVAQAIRP